MLKVLSELQKMVVDLERLETWSSHTSAFHNKSKIKSLKEKIKSQLEAFADFDLLDELVFSRCLAFYTSVAEHMMNILDALKPNHPTLSLGTDPAEFFRPLPVWVVNDMADFLLFGLQFFPSLVSTQVELSMVTWLISMICHHSHYSSNATLVPKLVEILFVVNPLVQEKTGEMYGLIMTHPICQEYLPGALMRFYTDLQQIGSSNELYDKFTIR